MSLGCCISLLLLGEERVNIIHDRFTFDVHTSRYEYHNDVSNFEGYLLVFRLREFYFLLVYA